MTRSLVREAAWKDDGRAGSISQGRIAPGRIILVAALIVLGIAVTVQGAFAQAGGQGDDAIDNPEPSSAEGAPRSLFQIRPDEPDPREEVTELPALPGSEGKVVSSDLDAVGTEIVGLLDPEEGGLGYDLWRGSSLRTIEPLLRALPGPGPSAGRQALLSGLLRSRTRDPAGTPHQIPFLTLRAQKLYDIGRLHDAGLMLDQAPDAPDAPSDLVSLRLLSELYLLTHRTRSACAIAARTRSASDEPWWSRLRTLCYIVAGDRGAAQLGADLLAEQGYDDPLFFLAVANRIDQAGLAYGDLKLEDAVHFALVAGGENAIGSGFPKEILNTSSSALRTASLLLADVTVRSADELVAVRIPLAEEGVMNGSLRPERLAILYGSVVLSEAEAAGLIKTAQTPSGNEGTPSSDEGWPSVRKSAAIYQAMSSAATSIDRAKLLKTAWDEAQRYDRHSLFVALYSEVLVSLPIVAELDIFAADFAWASLASEAWSEAGLWLEQARQAEARQTGASKGAGAREAGTRPDQSPVRDHLGNLGAVLQIVAPEAAQLEPDWIPALRLKEAAARGQVHQALLEVRLYEALGGRLDAETRQVLARYPPTSGGPMPATGVLSGLDAAARAGRRGEVILLALSAMGDSKSAQIPIIVTSKCVSGLFRTGFITEAKTLAIESLLAGLQAPFRPR